MSSIGSIAGSGMLAAAVQTELGTAILKKVLDAVQFQAEASVKMIEQAREIGQGAAVIDMLEEAADLQARLAAGVIDDELVGHMLDVLG